jgi:CRISPR system Cascade subunit CasE
VGLIAPEQVSTIFWAAVPAHELRVRDWSDFDAIHRAVMSLFDRDLPGEADRHRATAGVLFRTDDTGIGRIVLVQSTVPATKPTPGTVVKDASAVLQIPSGTAVRFRVAVNAVARNSVTTAGHRRVIERALDEDQIGQWLARKLTPALEQVSVLHQQRAVHRPRSGRHSKRVMQVDVVDGVATVADTRHLAELLVGGVGRGKAYGCALLTIAPIR